MAKAYLIAKSFALLLRCAILARAWNPDSVKIPKVGWSESKSGARYRAP